MEKEKEETIAAIATPAGNGGIGIVRISGPSSHSIAKRIFRKKRFSSISPDEFSIVEPTELRKRTLYFGHIVDPEEDRCIDEVLLVMMSAPHSYTCEDITEIQAHASAVGLNKILALVVKSGARLAEPGEFTKRAFLNGRIDLTQAEAVMDLITARNETSLRLAAQQLCGGLGDQIRCIIDELTKILSIIEASIDFSEEVEDVVDSNQSFDSFQKKIISPLKKLLQNYEEGHFLREGIRLVILGRPNVGKSSLMNCLLEKERVIVTAVPGTTRDTIEEQLNIRGLPILISDTAGIHDSMDSVETIGIQRAEKIAGEADLILFMIDAGEGVTAEDAEVYEKIKEKAIILIINKIDLENQTETTKVPSNWSLRTSVRMSVRFGKGIGKLKEKIYENSIGFNEVERNGFIPNLRQKEMIEKSLSAAEIAEKGIKKGTPPELTAIDLRNAIGVLNQIVGKDPQFDILDDIFSRFCIGK